MDVVRCRLPLVTSVLEAGEEQGLLADGSRPGFGSELAKEETEQGGPQVLAPAGCPITSQLCS